MIYEGYKVYGPYTAKDNRQRVCLVSNVSRKTVSYPKYLMELYLDRYLLNNETVDHIDGNPLNNIYSNLQILDRAIHCKLDAKRLLERKFICSECKTQFILHSSKLRHFFNNYKQNKRGPFCSKSCAGRYGQRIQVGGNPLPKRKAPLRTYTSLKKEFASVAQRKRYQV